MNEYFQKIVNCIKETNSSGLLVENSNVLTGFSGEAICGTLQRLSRELLNKDTCYLEVGVFQGLTLLSTASISPEYDFFGIDNFAFFDQDGENERIVNERISKLNITNAHLINSDYEDALEQLSTHIGNKKVGIYFIDGPHDYRSQLMCLLLIKPFLSENAVILVDDSNYRHVRQANRDFLISNPEFKLIYQSYTKSHPVNLLEKDRELSKKGWWNGINIICRDTNGELDSFFPDTLRDRTLYENEHILHSFKYPEQNLSILRILNKLNLFSILNIFINPKDVFVGKYKTANTYSETLPIDNYNSAVL